MKQEKQQALAFLEVLDALVDGLESGATNFAEVRADITQLRADVQTGLSPNKQDAEHEH